MPRPVLAVSLSAVAAYRECQQLYYYRYVERLRRKDKPLAPELGIILHEYLASYYTGLRMKERPELAHAEALQSMKHKYTAECRRMAKTLQEVGQIELAIEIAALPDKAARIAERYYKVRGKSDAKDHEILLVEEFITIPLFKGRAVSNGRLDMVTRDKKTGLVLLWEHKSTSEVPSIMYRLRDLQTPLYRRKIEQMKIAPKIDSVLWNYIRTKEPVVPRVLKNGQLERRKNLDSTWEIFLEALISHDLDQADYEDQKTRLDGRETSIYFQRFNQPILSRVDVLYRDFLQTVKEIARSRKAWAANEREPVRTLSQRCDWCELQPLCTAAILAGDDSDIKAMRFTVGS